MGHPNVEDTITVTPPWGTHIKDTIMVTPPWRYQECWGHHHGDATMGHPHVGDIIMIAIMGCPHAGDTIRVMPPWSTHIKDSIMAMPPWGTHMLGTPSG